MKTLGSRGFLSLKLAWALPTGACGYSAIDAAARRTRNRSKLSVGPCCFAAFRYLLMAGIISGPKSRSRPNPARTRERHRASKLTKVITSYRMWGLHAENHRRYLAHAQSYRQSLAIMNCCRAPFARAAGRRRQRTARPRRRAAPAAVAPMRRSWHAATRRESARGPP